MMLLILIWHESFLIVKWTLLVTWCLHWRILRLLLIVLLLVIVWLFSFLVNLNMEVLYSIYLNRVIIIVVLMMSEGPCWLVILIMIVIVMVIKLSSSGIYVNPVLFPQIAHKVIVLIWVSLCGRNINYTSRRCSNRQYHLTFLIGSSIII